MQTREEAISLSLTCCGQLHIHQSHPIFLPSKTIKILGFFLPEEYCVNKNAQLQLDIITKIYMSYKCNLLEKAMHLNSQNNKFKGFYPERVPLIWRHPSE